MGDDVYISEMAQVFEKRLNYVGNDLEIWEMAKIFVEFLRCMLHGLSI